MALQDAEASRQIQQMVNFIINEANDKAQEIEARALEDFNIEKLRLVQQMKNKVLQEYQQKAKQMQTQRAIARSTAINKSRLRKINARHVVVEEVKHGAANQLVKLPETPTKYKKFCTELIVQAAIRLLEAEVYVRCRQADEPLIKECLIEAEKLYKDILKKECGIDESVKLIIDSKHHLPPAPASKHDTSTCCLGGVLLTNMDGRITVNNTLDSRLDLVTQQCMPKIRSTLFPVTN